MKQRSVKKILVRAITGIFAVALIIGIVLWNRYLNKNSLLAKFVTEKEQEVYLLGTIHESHFNKWFHYSMEDVLHVIENVEPDVVYMEAREEYFREYGVVDGPIDMNVVYSYCLDNNITTEMIDWWVVDNNYQSNTTSTLRDDNMFNNIKDKLQSLDKHTKVLVVCGSGHFHEQSERFQKEGFIPRSISQKRKYFMSDNADFHYPPGCAEVWEKRAYFYAYTYPGLIEADDTLNEDIKKQFTDGNHDAFYRQQMEYCELFRN
ncbi:MAG: hypothetical protein NC231_07440 [Bacillus sp. (in: Bacteria)]|nr:hypothetical protein [Bacillus sp. (in: firmicutes)]MCM1426525.1 hypothetical protein [Eubacterium sp.]